jgi:hypothetical protein
MLLRSASSRNLRYRTARGPTETILWSTKLPPKTTAMNHNEPQFQCLVRATPRTNGVARQKSLLEFQEIECPEASGAGRSGIACEKRLRTASRNPLGDQRYSGLSRLPDDMGSVAISRPCHRREGGRRRTARFPRFEWGTSRTVTSMRKALNFESCANWV